MQARIGQFLGSSDDHYYLGEIFRNLISGCISPHFHLVFDDLYKTVICTKYDENIFNTICNDMLELNMDWYAKYEHDDNRKLIY